MSTIFVDVDTQIDFLYPAGALYVPGAERLTSTLASLNQFAAKNGIPVLSTMDAHIENDPEFQTWPPHCVAGTVGQQKPGVTLAEKRVVVPNRGGVPAIDGAQQILLEKQTVDCFTSIHLVPLLDRLRAQRCVVYGVVTEICVKNAIFGLLKTGRKVELVTDAIRELSTAAAERTIQEFQSAGGVLTTSLQWLGS
jgi:nicotinamidase/pyrazinamidase